MTIDPLKILTKRIRVRSLILLALMIGFICFSVFLFFQWVDPSLDGRTDRHIAADSVTYISAADALREGREDIYLTVALSTFPNTLLCPILLALLFKSTFAMVLADYAMFFLALILLKKSFSFSTGIFVGLLLLNATTTISLLSVNKEIVDVVAVSIFFFARQRRRYGVLLLALMLAVFNRFDVCIVMLLFLVADSKLNPWRNRRVITMAALIAVLSVALPLFASGILNARFREEVGSHTLAWFNALEMHYLFAVAVIPKIGMTLFSALITDPFKIATYYDYSDLANSSILYSNNFATAVVIVFLAWKRRLTVSSDLVYFALLGLITVAVSMETTQRYIYFVYVILCLQAAKKGTMEKEGSVSFNNKQDDRGNGVSLPFGKKAAFD